MLFPTRVNSYLSCLCIIAAIPFASACGNLSDTKSEVNGYVLMKNKWPSSTIPICFEQVTPANAKERGWIRERVTAEFSRTAVSFTGWEACQSNSRGIRFSMASEWPHSQGLGKEVDGKPSGVVVAINYKNLKKEDGRPAFLSCLDSEPARRECIETIAIHELGHAIGLAHEQNRSDTPSSCTEGPQGTDGDTKVGPWDGESAMNYCNPLWNNFGVLSLGDLAAIKYMYGERPDGTNITKDFFEKQGGTSAQWRVITREDSQFGLNCRDWATREIVQVLGWGQILKVKELRLNDKNLPFFIVDLDGVSCSVRATVDRLAVTKTSNVKDISASDFERAGGVGSMWKIVTKEDSNGLNCRNWDTGEVMKAFPFDTVFKASAYKLDSRGKPQILTKLPEGECALRATADRLAPAQGSSPAEEKFPKWCKIQSSDGTANVRKGPGSQHAVIKVLNNGASVKLIRAEGTWYSTEFILGGVNYGEANNNPAWVAKSLVSCP